MQENISIAVIFAGGVGRRFKNSDVPKQFVEVFGAPIIIHTLRIFDNHPEIDKIYISILPSHKEYMQRLIKEYGIQKVKGIVNGGETGQDSIYNGLMLAANENPLDSLVLIHDGVRPIVSSDTISNNIKLARVCGNAITCTPCTETILVSKNGTTPDIIPYRSETYSAQAPQTFVLGEIINVHNIVRKQKTRYEDLVDSCTLYKKLGKETFMVYGNFGNIKVTNPMDIYVLEALLKYNAELTSNFQHMKKNNDFALEKTYAEDSKKQYC